MGLPTTLKLWRRNDQGQVETWEIENYVPYVVANEVPSYSWPTAAVRAQAVAVRTYAVYHATYPKHPSMGAHLCDRTCCQVFLEQTNIPALLARDATRGVVLLAERNNLIQSEYSACCGGTIPGCPCDCGDQWGHGRGMCQHGAKEMALQGATWKEILAFYYPDTHLSKGDNEMDIEAATEFLLETTMPEVPYHPRYALARAAREARLGLPITDEITKMWRGRELVVQYFNKGAVWAEKGDWENVHVAEL